MKFFNEIKSPADPKQGGGFVGKTPADNLPQNSTKEDWVYIGDGYWADRSRVKYVLYEPKK